MDNWELMIGEIGLLQFMFLFLLIELFESVVEISTLQHLQTLDYGLGDGVSMVHILIVFSDSSKEDLDIKQKWTFYVHKKCRVVNL